MFEEIWDTDNRKVAVDVTIRGTGRFYVMATDLKPNSKYAERCIDVTGERTVTLKFPACPKKMKIVVKCLKNAGSPNFQVALNETDLVQYEIHMDEVVTKFFDLMVPFAEMKGFTTKVSPNGTIWQHGEFRFKYYTSIRDSSGKSLNTPARVGHSSRIIEFSKEKLDPFTIPEVIAIGTHEFGHVYRNPQIGLPISNEKGADLWALYYCLGQGFSKVDIVHAFAKVFYNADTPQNRSRMRKIMDFIKRFENQEFAKKY